MNAPLHRFIETPSLSFAEATDILDQNEVRRAYLIDAVTVGLHMVNETEKRDYPTMLRALFTAVHDNRVYFGLFEGERRLALMLYSYVPEIEGIPVLEETDDGHYRVGPSALTRRLQPVFDHVLGKMEQQVWAKVQFP
jgi:hypothetical protein